MNTEIIEYEEGGGWYGVFMGLDEGDIDKLIDCLKELKKDKSYHFHIVRVNWESEEGGIIDIQFTRKLKDEIPTMEIT